MNILVLALFVSLTTNIINQHCQTALSESKLKSKPLVFEKMIVQQYGADDPHGEDPHGVDPHEEYHDETLPAYEAQDKYKAPDNVYGSDVTNTKAPY